MTDFRIRVVVDPSGAVAGNKRVQRSLNKTARTANQLRRVLLQTFGLLGLGAAIRGTIRIMATFEQSIANVAAVAGATGDEFDKLRERAQDLGATTRFTATEAAQGLELLARAGFTVSESIATVDDTLRLAQAGGLALANAAQITTTAIKGFRLETSEASRVVDVLAQAAANSNTNVKQLGLALSFAAPVASGLGVSIEEATAAIGALSNAGLQASRAGTGLNRVLAELESPSEKTTKLFKAIGVSTDDVRISSVGLTAALKVLREAGIDAGTALEIFGQRGGPAFEILSNSIPDIIELRKKLENAEGAATKIAAVMDDNLNAALLRVKAQLQAVILELGETERAGGAIRGTVEGLATTFRFLAKNADELFIVLETLAFILAGKIVFALFSATAAAGAFSASMQVAITSFGRFIAVVSLANPLLLVAAATIAIVKLEFLEMSRNLEAAAKAFKDLETDSKFIPQLGSDIRRARQQISIMTNALQQAGRITREERAEIQKLTQAAFAGTAEQSSMAVIELRKLLEQTKAFSEFQITSIEKQIALSRKNRDEIKKQSDAEREFAKAQEQRGVTLENTLRRLDKEAAALRRVTRESQIELRVQKELDKLLRARETAVTGDNAAKARRQIKDRITENDLLGARKSAIEDILGPLEELRRTEAGILRALEDAPDLAEQLGVEKANELMQGLRASLKEIREELQTNPFEDQLRSLEDTNSVLRARLNLGDVAATLLQEELRTGKELNESERERFETNLKINKQLLTALETKRRIIELENRPPPTATLDALRMEEEFQLRLIKVSTTRADALRLLRNRGLDPTNKALVDITETQLMHNRVTATALRLSEEFRSAEEDLKITIDAVKIATDSGAISQEFANQKLIEAEIASLKFDQSLKGGLSRGLLRIEQQLNDVGSVAETALVNAFGSAEDALVEFVTKGRASFKDFANSVLEDIARMLVRLLLLQAFELATTGGLSSGLFGLGGSTRQSGGPVQANRPFLVGEGGPEIFVPAGQGNILPAEQTAAMMGSAGETTVVTSPPPVVNVNITNLIDPVEIVRQGLTGGANDREITQSIGRNRSRTKQMIG